MYRFIITTSIVMGLASTAMAAVIQSGLATTDSVLGADYLLDDASTGGADVTTNEPSVLLARRPLALEIGSTGSEVTITGIGWASSVNTTANDADTVEVTITYLGLDGVGGGGDDVDLGTVTDAYATHSAAGEVAWLFDTPIVATVDGLNNQFRLRIVPTNAAGNGSLRFKSAVGADSGIDGPKLSIAGTSQAIPEPTSLVLVALSGLLLRRR